MQLKVPIILGCDCDPDRLSFNRYANTSTLNWDGIKYGISEFNNARKAIFDQTGIFFKMTWFVRSDLEILKKCGSYSYCFREFQEIWENQIQAGDEIAWHPHFWNVLNNVWYQETTDVDFQIQMLDAAYQEISQIEYVDLQGTHSGWCYQNGSTLRTLNDFGMKYDCSALPGNNTLGFGTVDQSDWVNAPLLPYNPDFVDHTANAGKKLNKKRIIEIPATVVHSTKAQLVRSVNEVIKRRAFEANIVKRFQFSYPQLCLNQSLTGDLFAKSVSDLQLGENPYLFFYGHADEFLDKGCKKIIKNMTYGKNYMIQNLLSITQKAKACGLELRPSTMSEQWSKI
ncbi:hypothetical protein N9P96_00025 [bacterium]|nr:hypothetical protein [bacterium]